MFFSAVLAGYFAWRTVRSSPEADINSLSDDSPNEKTSLKDKDESNFTRVCFNLFITFGFASFFFIFLSFFFSLSLLMLVFVELQSIQNGFWVFVDMASGRYLWRNLREIKKH